MKTITGITCAGLLGLALLSVWQIMNRAEVSECRRWAAQAMEYKDYYLTKWQSEQCQNHGIAIDAPVK